MSRAALLLPIEAGRHALPALVSGIAAALALDAAAPLAHRPRAPAWVLAQAIEEDAAARRRAADHALRLLRADASVAAARRITAGEMAADLRDAIGSSLPPDAPTPELIEARLSPGADPAAVSKALRHITGLAITAAPTDPPIGRAARAACLLAIGAAAGAVVAAAAIDARSRSGSIAILHRLGAGRSRIVAEVAVPTIASVATGIVAGTAVAALLPARPDVPGLLLVVPCGLLLAAVLASLWSARRQIEALA